MTREEAIKKLESLKISLPAAKDEISDIIKLIESPWISVEDDLPCYHPELMRNEVYTKKIIVLLNDGRIRDTDMFYDKWCQYRKKITHWKPFIEPTKE